MADGPSEGGRQDVHGSPRVAKWKLRRLYERAAWREKFASTYWPPFLAGPEATKGDSRCAP